MDGPEDLVDTAVAALQGGIDAALAALEAKYAGGPHELPLPRPRTEDYYPGGVGQVLRYPTIEVAVPDLSGDTFSIDQHESDVTTVGVVRCWMQHPRFDVLYRTTNRYGSAIFNVLASPDAATGRGCGWGAAVTVKRYRAAWRWNPQANELDQVTSAVLLVFDLDAPDIRP